MNLIGDILSVICHKDYNICLDGFKILNHAYEESVISKDKIKKLQLAVLDYDCEAEDISCAIENLVLISREEYDRY